MDICPQHKQGAAYPVVPMGKKAPQVFAFRFPLAAWWHHAYFFCSFPILEWFLSAILMGNSSAFALFSFRDVTSPACPKGTSWPAGTLGDRNPGCSTDGVGKARSGENELG